jgi:hypothetical protein|tara:strand:+ start:255 stop:455 length:201 start_codon:yes stop_codon:yes gene_type:complete
MQSDPIKQSKANITLIQEVKNLKLELPSQRAQAAAMVEILHVIERSTNDIQQVFDTIAKSATELCS